ncbi:MAG: hypothetical protein OEY62_07850, partial [Acidimicrobiia bacterium]|nr:hypothetical protein [Acidimicrobiia bacterium]
MNERYRAAVLILVLAVLAAFTAMPVLAQTAPAVPGCPLTDGIVLNAQGDAWGLHFLRSDGSAAQARLGPGPGVVPAGRYDVVLAGWDRHEDGDEPQLNEQWFLEGRNGATVAFQSGATPDLADEANLIVSTVNTNVEVPAFSSVVARHAAYPNTESPNSIWPLCASFIPV